MTKDKSYLESAQEDAIDTLENFLDEMVEQWAEGGEVSDDMNNDYADGDSYHHGSHVDRSYNLTEAATILDELSDYEEDDYGLWEGMAPREAISAQAAYTYGNAVYGLWRQHITKINADLERLDFDTDEEKAWFGRLYITAYVLLQSRFKPDDCQGMVRRALCALEDGDTDALTILCDWIEEKETGHLHFVAKQLRAILAEKPTPEEPDEDDEEEEDK